MPNKYPIDAINPEAMRGRRPPPKAKPVPKTKMTMEQIQEQMKKAGQMGPVSPRKRTDMEGSGPRYAKGGSVTRADGVCQKGHTKGRMV